MKVIETEIKDVKIIEPKVFGDARGWFMESYSYEKYCQIGICNKFVQDNMSYSQVKGTLRGIHFQNDPYSQAKLVRVIKGEVIDVAVDLRRGSKSYKKWVAVKLTADNHRQLYIPAGFGHGFLTLTNDVEFEYKVDNYYNKESEGSIKYDDEEININWGSLLAGIEPVLSEKDKKANSLVESNHNFIYKGDK